MDQKLHRGKVRKGKQKQKGRERERVAEKKRKDERRERQSPLITSLSLSKSFFQYFLLFSLSLYLSLCLFLYISTSPFFSLYISTSPFFPLSISYSLISLFLSCQFSAKTVCPSLSLFLSLSSLSLPVFHSSNPSKFSLLYICLSPSPYIIYFTAPLSAILIALSL